MAEHGRGELIYVRDAETESESESTLANQQYSRSKLIADARLAVSRV